MRQIRYETRKHGLSLLVPYELAVPLLRYLSTFDPPVFVIDDVPAKECFVITVPKERLNAFELAGLIRTVFDPDESELKKGRVG